MEAVATGIAGGLLTATKVVFLTGAVVGIVVLGLFVVSHRAWGDQFKFKRKKSR